MAICEVEFSKDAYKAYQKIANVYQSKIDIVIERLADKKMVDIKPVKGEKDIYRLRIGKYRILIKFFYNIKSILVIKIGSRGGIYK
ncbi:MAG: type II toxin-antitoxin system RelE/ParE family toxin [Nitrospirae bacterium]|nr:type II toxin-antitoxin system RelE/ParE family toxin [Nitrospirota bacterium]MBF0540272.1 type II toxin-antitoxin system RelE/ParE family toxin [Nitrospirota bacterium]